MSKTGNHGISEEESEYGAFWCTRLGRKCDEATADTYQCYGSSCGSDTTCEEDDNGVEFTDDD